MFLRRACYLAFVSAFVLSSTGCGISIWPWGDRGNSTASELRRESKPDKCARLVREVCDAATAIRRSDLLEMEGAALVGARGRGADESARIANRASDAARSAAAAYVAALLQLSKLPDPMVDAQLASFAYQDREKQELLATLKPVIHRNLRETRLGLKPTPEACLQDLQSIRYAH